MMYMMTAEQHAQIVEALKDLSNGLVVHEGAWRTRQHVALAMLKAMQPVEPVACVYKGNQYMRHEFMDDKIPEGSMPLYTPTKDCK